MASIGSISVPVKSRKPLFKAVFGAILKKGASGFSCDFTLSRALSRASSNPLYALILQFRRASSASRSLPESECGKRRIKRDGAFIDIGADQREEISLVSTILGVFGVERHSTSSLLHDKACDKARDKAFEPWLLTPIGWAARSPPIPRRREARRRRRACPARRSAPACRGVRRAPCDDRASRCS